MSKVYAYIILAFIIALFYGNTLFNGFVHDDIWQIAGNKNLTSIGNLPKIFTTCIADEILGTCYNKGFYYRPLQFVSYLFTYQISKDAWAFHLVNLLYAVGVGALVFWFFRMLFTGHPELVSGSPARRQVPRHLRGVRMDSSKVYFLLATVFFLTHPINSEVINWIGGVPELLLGISTIGMLICYIKFSVHYSSRESRAKSRENREVSFLNSSRQARTISSGGGFRFLIFSAIFFFLALFSKEAGFFALFLLISYEVVFVGIKKKREALQKYFQAFMFYLVPLILYLLLRASVLGRIVYEYEGYYAMTFWQQVGNAIALFPKYIFKLFYPLPLSLQHSFTPKTEFDAGVAFGILVVGAFGFLLYLAARKKQKILAFGMLFFLITLSPYLIFVNKLGEFAFSERYLFLPSIGFTLIVFEVVRLQGHALVRKRPRLFRSVGILVFAIYLAVSWYIVAVNRNKDWKDNLASYQSIVRANPDNQKANAQVYTILFGLSSKEYSGDHLSFNYPGDWVIEEFDSCDSAVLEPHPNPLLKGEGKTSGVGSGLKGEGIFPSPSPFGRGGGEGIPQNGGCILLTNSDKSFTVLISVDKKPVEQTIGEYLERQEDSLGTLINQGPALIPNFDSAHVKVWNDSSTPSAGSGQAGSEQVGKLQFFLFKNDAVVEIRVWPSESEYMRDFDAILGSLDFE